MTAFPACPHQGPVVAATQLTVILQLAGVSPYKAQAMVHRHPAGGVTRGVCTGIAAAWLLALLQTEFSTSCLCALC